jgi:hypothetical protein
VPPFLVLLANLLVALILVMVGVRGFLSLRLTRTSVGFALLPLVDAVLLASFVFGEDSYRDNGISRWNAYRSPGGALGPMFVASLALLIVCAALLVYSVRRDRGELFASTACLSGTASFFLVSATIIGFSAN